MRKANASVAWFPRSTTINKIKLTTSNISSLTDGEQKASINITLRLNVNTSMAVFTFAYMRICSSLFTFFFVMEASREIFSLFLFNENYGENIFPSLRNFRVNSNSASRLLFLQRRAKSARQLTGDNENTTIRSMKSWMFMFAQIFSTKGQQRRENGGNMRTGAPIKRIIRPRFHWRDKSLNSNTVDCRTFTLKLIQHATFNAFTETKKETKASPPSHFSEEE